MSITSCWSGKTVFGNHLQAEHVLRKLKRIVNTNHFANSSNLTREWNKSGVCESRATMCRRLQEMEFKNRIPVIKPLLIKKQRPNVRVNYGNNESFPISRWKLKLYVRKVKLIKFGWTLQKLSSDNRSIFGVDVQLGVIWVDMDLQADRFADVSEFGSRRILGGR